MTMKGFIRVLEYVGSEAAILDAMENRFVKDCYSTGELLIREVIISDTIIRPPFLKIEE